VRERTRQITLRATAEQFFRWESSGRMFNRDLPRFIVVAADLYARRLREMHWQRVRRDPIAERLEEKVLLGRLLEAARVAVQHLPKHVDTYMRGRQDPKGDLQNAVEDVLRFLARTGEEYGPCP
jgi:hypothetical protein